MTKPKMPRIRRAPQPRTAGDSLLSGRWQLWFTPRGAEVPKALERASTLQAAQRLAEVYNRLEWSAHVGLGADGFIALGRNGSFILEPIP